MSPIYLNKLNRVLQNKGKNYPSIRKRHLTDYINDTNSIDQSIIAIPKIMMENFCNFSLPQEKKHNKNGKTKLPVIRNTSITLTQNNNTIDNTINEYKLSQENKNLKDFLYIKNDLKFSKVFNDEKEYPKISEEIFLLTRNSEEFLMDENEQKDIYIKLKTKNKFRPNNILDNTYNTNTSKYNYTDKKNKINLKKKVFPSSSDSISDFSSQIEKIKIASKKIKIINSMNHNHFNCIFGICNVPQILFSSNHNLITIIYL